MFTRLLAIQLFFSDNVWPQDRQTPEKQKNKRRALATKLSSPPKYKRRKVADPMFDYMEAKKVQASKDMEVRMEIHRDMMKDNETERALKHEQLILERERLQLEAVEKERMFSLLSNAFQHSKSRDG